MNKIIYEEESYRIRGACFDVYKEMGPGFLEAVYQECLEREFLQRNIPSVSQQELTIRYKGEPLRQTFLCWNKIIIEIKSVKTIAPEHQSQLINYLKATNMKLGFLVNFGSHPQIQIERFVL